MAIGTSTVNNRLNSQSTLHHLVSSKMSTGTQFIFNNFQNFACEAQKNMRNNELCDVTLASTDGHKFKAHKVILAAYSNVFKNMLVSEKHSHPLIFVGGIGHEVLEALLDFIYCGEAKLQN